MSPGELERYLHAHIPLSAAMATAVERVDEDEVVLSAPLGPNINHRDTVFGGSVSALATLAAWSLLHVRLATGGRTVRLVIQHNTMRYDRAIAGRFTATAELVAVDWARFLHTLDRRGRARISAGADIASEGRPAGRFDGRFVALADDRTAGGAQ